MPRRDAALDIPPPTAWQFSTEHKDRQPFTNSKVGANMQAFVIYVKEQ